MTSSLETVQDEALRIAVVSDLHACDDVGSDASVSPSHLKISLPNNEPGKHPISGLLKLIETEALRADILLCAGDMGDKAQPSGIKYAWKAVHEIGRKLGASLITATSGNHDLDSRFLTTPDADPKGILLGLDPPYPLPDEALNDKYWARNYVIIDNDHYRLIILNSCAQHGTEAHEIEHGRISSHTLAAIAKDLDRSEPRTINLLLCHHHPQQHMELNLGDYDAMKNGQLLLDMLATGKYGRWLIIHGHKHHPKVVYASGPATSPTIFSAGSLCAVLYPELQTKARNQFYLLSMPFEHIRQFGLVGTIQAWDWAFGEGWAPAASTNSGLPAVSAFGFRGDPRQTALRISSLVRNKKGWDDICNHLPEATYYLSQDLETLRVELEMIGFRMTEESGHPKEVGRAL
jgi:hypothetical protein